MDHFGCTHLAHLIVGGPGVRTVDISWFWSSFAQLQIPSCYRQKAAEKGIAARFSNAKNFGISPSQDLRTVIACNHQHEYPICTFNPLDLESSQKMWLSSLSSEWCFCVSLAALELPGLGQPLKMESSRPLWTISCFFNLKTWTWQKK